MHFEHYTDIVYHLIKTNYQLHLAYFIKYWHVQSIPSSIKYMYTGSKNSSDEKYSFLNFAHLYYETSLKNKGTAFGAHDPETCESKETLDFDKYVASKAPI